MTKQKATIIILAAGKGTRMKSSRPKVMHALAGRSMIGHVLETARALDPARCCVVIGPDMDDVRAAIAPVETVIQKKQLGTGHAVQAALEELGPIKGDILVLFGDTPLLQVSTLQSLMATLDLPPFPSVCVLAMRPKDPGQYGRLITREGGIVTDIVEYAEAGSKERAIPLCNSGVMALRGEVLTGLLEKLERGNAKGEYYLTDIIKLATARGLACSYVEANEEELLGVNSRSDLARAEAALQDRLRRRAMENGVTLLDPSSVYFSFDTVLGSDTVVGPHVFFGRGVKVGPGVAIRGFCHIEEAIIGEGAVIGPFARLRPGTDIGAQAHIGNFVEIKKSTVAPGAKVNHLSYIGDARIGAQANIGAGTITCNYDGFKKGVTEIGARAFIGSNSALVAPVRVGEGAIIGAGSVITHDVAKDMLSLARGEQKDIPSGAAKFRAARQGMKKGMKKNPAPGGKKTKKKTGKKKKK